MENIPDHPTIRNMERTGYPCHSVMRYRPRKYTDCDWCGTEIQDGDEYYEIHGEILCAECVNECRKEAGA